MKEIKEIVDWLKGDGAQKIETDGKKCAEKKVLKPVECYKLIHEKKEEPKKEEKKDEKKK